MSERIRGACVMRYTNQRILLYYYYFLCRSGFGMLLLGKTQKKNPGDLPHTVPELSPPPAQNKSADKYFKHFLMMNYMFTCETSRQILRRLSLGRLNIGNSAIQYYKQQ